MSKPGISQYHRPETLEEVWDHVAPGNPSVRLLSGGADLTIHAPDEVTTLVDVSRVLDRAIEVTADGSIRLGAMATLSDVMEHQAVAAYATGVIPEMMVHVGNPLLRNFSTIGGHVARGKLSDVVPVLLALDAGVRLFDGESRDLSLADYYESAAHGRPHIVTDLHLPALPSGSAAAFLRFARTAFDFPILNVCCRVDVNDGVVAEARIVCGATPKRAHRAQAGEESLTGSLLTAEAIQQASSLARGEIPTGSGWVASAEYRTQLVETLTRRCLTKVAERLEAA